MGKSKKKSSSTPAPVDDDSGWETVVNKDKIKYEERKQRQAQRRAEEKARAAHEEKTTQSTLFARSFYDFEEEDRSKSKVPEAATSSMKHSTFSKRPKKKKIPGLHKPSTDKEMADLISDIITSTPGQTLMIAAIGERVADQTGCVWNKAFKQRFGTLKKFIDGHSDLFVIDPEGKVWLRSFLKDVSAADEAEKKKQQQKENSARRRNTSDQKHSGGSKSSTGKSSSSPKDRDDEQPDSVACLCVKTSFVFFLFTAVGAVTYVLVTGSSYTELTDLVKGTVANVRAQYDL